jgi:tRNA threonylcarbamoyl adenosine modification protein YeaZ
MKILALEFSSPQRSVAVAAGGRAASEVIEAGAGGTQAFGMIEAALLEAKLEREQIECLVVGLGPGSYHGIRVAIALAQGWQLARGIQLLGISSVECLAAQTQAEKISGRINVVIDAQRGEFYIAGYEINAAGRKEIAPLRLATRTEVEQCTVDGILVGPEVTRWFPPGKIVFPRAAMLAELAASRNDFVPGEKLEPIYLRETNFVKAPPSRIIA